MASGRFLSRTIATDPQLAQLSLAAEMLYLKAIPYLDRDGICTGEPIALLGMISPFRFSELQGQVSSLVDEWVSVGLVVRYPTPTGLHALWFKGFSKQQKIYYERETASQYPPPPGYIRGATGLIKSTDVPWVAESRFSGENRDLPPQNRDSSAQQQQESEAEQQQESEAEQQQQQDATALAAVAVLRDYGITGNVLDELSRCPVGDIRGWIAYATTQSGLTNPRGFVIKQLRAHATPPPIAEEEDRDSYEALKRRYVPEGKEWQVVH